MTSARSGSNCLKKRWQWTSTNIVLTSHTHEQEQWLYQEQQKFPQEWRKVNENEEQAEVAHEAPHFFCFLFFPERRCCSEKHSSSVEGAKRKQVEEPNAEIYDHHPKDQEVEPFEEADERFA